MVKNLRARYGMVAHIGYVKNIVNFFEVTLLASKKIEKRFNVKLNWSDVFSK